MGNIDKNRRKWLSLGGIVLGASMMPTSVLAMVSYTQTSHSQLL